MIIARSAEELAVAGRQACLAIGFFDGVHLGHQQIIRQAAADAQQHDARTIVVTFDRHPASIVAPERAPLLIQTESHRLRTIGALGANAALVLTFDNNLRKQSGADFIHALHRSLGGIRSICIGADFHFGYQRSGNVALLRELGKELGFSVHGVASVALNGHTISSTRIRAAISQGDLGAVSEMLGRAYSIENRVIRGDQLGHALGFPTANLDVGGLALPPRGVYAAQTIVDGQLHHSVVNIGVRPTIDDKASDVRAEVHLLDADADLYEKMIEVILVEKLRDEKRFDSRDALQQQIRADVERTRQIFS